MRSDRTSAIPSSTSTSSSGARTSSRAVRSTCGVPPFFYPTERVLTLSDHLLGPAVAHLLLRKAGPTVPRRLQRAAGRHVLAVGLGGLPGAETNRALRGGGARRGMGLRVLGLSLGHDRTLPGPAHAVDPGGALDVRPAARPPDAGPGPRLLLFYALHVSGGAYLASDPHPPGRPAGQPLGAAPRPLRLPCPPSHVVRQRSRPWACSASLLPYLTSGSDLGTRHPAEEVKRTLPLWVSFLAPAAGTLDARLLAFLPRDAARVSLSPGFAVLALAGVALVGRGRRRASPPRVSGTGRVRASPRGRRPRPGGDGAGAGRRGHPDRTRRPRVATPVATRRSVGRLRGAARAHRRGRARRVGRQPAAARARFAGRGRRSRAPRPRGPQSLAVRSRRLRRGDARPLPARLLRARPVDPAGDERDPRPAAGVRPGRLPALVPRGRGMGPSRRAGPAGPRVAGGAGGGRSGPRGRGVARSAGVDAHPVRAVVSRLRALDRHAPRGEGLPRAAARS